MEATAVYQVSLVAAFIAGMVALFAPCCLSYLLPAYLGNVFKERRRLLGMTLIYGAGIFTVMLPVVLGARQLAALLFSLHDQAYIVGGAVMIGAGLLALLGLKMPLPRFLVRLRVATAPAIKKQRGDVLTTYTLGLVAGITSACCAPVLVGIITLSALSLSWLSALAVGVVYVAGMVAPLLLAALLLRRGNFLAWPVWRKNLGNISIFGQRYALTLANALAAIVFIATGVTLIIFAMTGRLAMTETEAARRIVNTATQVEALLARISWWQTTALILIIGLISYFIYRKPRAKVAVDVDHACCDNPSLDPLPPQEHGVNRHDNR